LVQTVPHAPQSLTDVVRFVSQPLPTFPSQLPKPESHAIWHAPSEQLAVPFVLLHTVPHAPQLPTLVSVLTSQPLVPMPSQFANPELHAPSRHVPVEQDSVAFGRSHVCPHAPQSVSVTSAVSQVDPSPSQSPKPALQDDTPQVPPEQLGVPPATGQTLPHEPQLLTLTFVFVSQPFVTSPSQSS
jgi:hypothetical protein